MNTVFTNDSKYLSARDDLLAVNFDLLRKQLLLKKILKNFSSDKSKKDLMAISELLSQFSMTQFLK